MARLIPALLILLTLAAFWPVLTCEFTTWDDSRTVVHTPWLNPPAWSHFAEFWNPRPPVFMDIYIPLTYTIWSGVASLSYVPVPDPETGAFLNPWVFHGANLAIHIVSVLLVYAILKRLTGKPWASAAGAALFAIHPVQVEPVAWVSGMKDVLAGCLSLVAIWQYLVASPVARASSPCQSAREQPTSGDSDRALGHGQDAHATSAHATRAHAASAHATGGHAVFHYVIATLAFVLAMLAKPSAVVLPLVVATIDLGLLRRSIRQVAAALIPWLLLAIPIVVEGRIAQPASPLGYITPVHLRPLIAADALAFYLYKLFAPLWLGIVYDHTPQSALRHGWPYFTWMLPLAVLIAAWVWRRRLPWLLPAIAVFWLAVLPVLGLVPFDFQDHSTVADHYLYLAMLGPAIAAAYLLRDLRGRGVAIGCAVILAALSVRSFAQTWTWRNSYTLYTHALEVNPHGWVTRENLAILYDNAGKPQEAMKQLQIATVDLPPSVTDQAAHHESLGDALTHLHRYAEALKEYETVERLVPGNAVIGRKVAALRKVLGSPGSQPR